MNNNEWINELPEVDSKNPKACVDGEEIYTLNMRDFLKMPEVNFMELAKYDPQIRALMN